LLRQLSMFALVGSLATAAQYAVLIVLVLAGMTAPLASAVGFVLSASLNYWCNYHYTFRSRQQHAVAAMRFIAVGGLGLALNSVIVYVLVGIQWHYLLAQVCATAAVLAFNFAANRSWTFAAARQGAARGALEPPALAARALADRDLLLILGLTAGIRLAICLVTDNQPGDADLRAVLSGVWSLHPQWIKVGPWLPLHFYTTGVLTWLFGNPITAGKALSFVMGTLTVVPLFLLTQRLFDRPTALVTAVLFSVYGTEIDLSCVVMSEAPFIFFTTWAAYLLFRETSSEHPRGRFLIAAALLMSLAGGFRQEAWQLSALFAACLLLDRRTRAWAVPFAAVALTSFAVFSISNVIQDRGWLHSVSGVGHAKSKEALYHHFSAAENVMRWLWIAVQSPGPFISVLSAWGLYRALRQRSRMSLGLIALAFLVPYVVLSLARPQWQPQSRYPLVFFELMLPYGAAALLALRHRTQVRHAVLLIVVLSVAGQALSYARRSHLGLPVPDYEPSDVSAWRWLRAHAGTDERLIVEDIDWRAPGLIAHSGLYGHDYRIVSGKEDTAVLDEMLHESPGQAVLLVLHSPLTRWLPGVQRAGTIEFANADYRIVRLKDGPS